LYLIQYANTQNTMSPLRLTTHREDSADMTEKKDSSNDLNLELPPTITVGSLAEHLDISPIEIIKQLMRAGIMAGINQSIDYGVASNMAKSYGFVVKEETTSENISTLKPSAGETENQESRSPVVAFLGHVDHGKTSLLDYIRESRVAMGEVGGITQRIGAYQARIADKMVTFLDTPGHEAFTALRARGAQVTDIAVLVVAADDGVMPQTIEAINHIQAANVPMIVAINKMDLPGADPDRVKNELSRQNVLVEEWGGEIVSTHVSAETGDGIDTLLENISLVAEIEELQGDPSTAFSGVVIESRLDSTRGSLATVLVQSGTLHKGTHVAAGPVWGRVRAMLDHQGERIDEAGLSMPIEILGLNGVPDAGEIIQAMPNEREAKGFAETRKNETVTANPTISLLDQISAQVQQGERPKLVVLVKADLQGSLEAVRGSIEKLGSDSASIMIIHSATGNISESDVFLASASNGLIVGFNTRIEPGAKRLAESENVEIRSYDIIYRLIEDIQEAIHGLATPIVNKVLAGRLEVRQIFDARRTKIAGCLVTEGQALTSSDASVIRNGKTLHESSILTLRHFQDNVEQVNSGQECGLTIEGFNEYEEGDIIEVYRVE
jgi:translation initiation factor IF-2